MPVALAVANIHGPIRVQESDKAADSVLDRMAEVNQSDARDLSDPSDVSDWFDFAGLSVLLARSRRHVLIFPFGAPLTSCPLTGSLLAPNVAEIGMGGRW
jgi:hypothetical protein